MQTKEEEPPQTGSTLKKELVLQGLGVSDGVAIGHLILVPECQVESDGRESISPTEVHREIWRYRRALDASREELEQTQLFLARDAFDLGALHVIEAHLQMLSDPIITEKVERRIEEKNLPSDMAFRIALGEVEEILAKSPALFASRVSDIKDLFVRVLSHLDGHRQLQINFPRLPPSAIVAAREFAPTHAAESESRIKAFVSKDGSETSHVVLIARAKGIPYVANIDYAKLLPYHGEQVIVDGALGLVILSPTLETLARYLDKKRALEAEAQKGFLPLSKLSLADGTPFKLWATVDSVEDMQRLLTREVEGVGLCRSELLFLGEDLRLLSEESQYRVYKKLLLMAGEMPFVFRFFDIGSDKPFSSGESKEPNPALGLRSIRFLLKEEEILRRQMRAILRASVGHSVRLLIPLATDPHEILQTRALMHISCEELLHEGIHGVAPLPLGAMIETPAAVMMVDHLAGVSDFISIGTNDLAQYTLVADRLNPLMAHYYQHLHPALLRMLAKIVSEPRIAGKTLSVCGEIASNPLVIPLLIGLGFRVFSSSIRHLDRIARSARDLTLPACGSLVYDAMHLASSGEIQRILADFLGRFRKSDSD